MTPPPDFFKIYWLVWIFLGFGLAEWYALKTVGTQGTLSYFVWWIIDIGSDGQRDLKRWIARGAFTIGTVWLVHHFYTRGNFFS